MNKSDDCKICQADPTLCSSVHFEDDHPPKPSEPIELDRCILDEILRVANPKIVYMGGDKSRPPRVSIDAFALLEWVKSLPKKEGK